MWDIDSTSQMLKHMSATSDPGQLLRLFLEHIRRTVHVDRAIILSGEGLHSPQYRVLRIVAWDSSAGLLKVTEPAEVREGGLLATLLYLGQFQNIREFSPPAADSAFDLPGNPARPQQAYRTPKD